jgi:hypothetical protein
VLWIIIILALATMAGVVGRSKPLSLNLDKKPEPPPGKPGEWWRGDPEA